MAQALDDELARNADALALKGFAIPDRDIVLSMFASSPDCIKILNLDGTLSFMTHGGMCAMEIDNLCDVVGRKWWDLWPEEERPRLRSLFDRALAGHESQFKAFCPTALGTPKHWRIRLSPMTSHTGVVVGVLCSSRELRVEPGPA